MMPDIETLLWKKDSLWRIGDGLVCYNVPGPWVFRIMHVDSIKATKLADLETDAASRCERDAFPYLVLASVSVGSHEETLFAKCGWRWVLVGSATSEEAAKALAEHEAERRPLEWTGMGVAYL